MNCLRYLLISSLTLSPFLKHLLRLQCNICWNADNSLFATCIRKKKHEIGASKYQKVTSSLVWRVTTPNSCIQRIWEINYHTGKFVSPTCCPFPFALLATISMSLSDRSEESSEDSASEIKLLLFFLSDGRKVLLPKAPFFRLHVCFEPLLRLRLSLPSSCIFSCTWMMRSGPIVPWPTISSRTSTIQWRPAQQSTAPLFSSDCVGPPAA